MSHLKLWKWSLGRSVCALLLALFCGSAWAQQASDLDKVVSFDVPAQSVSTALIALSQQAGIQVIMPGSALDSVKTQGVHGQMSLRQALFTLLHGTSLTFRETAPSTITVAGGVSGRADGLVELAQSAGTAADTQPAAPGNSDNESGQVAGKQKPQELEKVTVTGSRLPRTAKEGAQDVKVYSRQQIEQSGQSSVTDFLNTLPDVSVSVGENGYTSIGGATTVQVHGLPVGTTLTLIDGRRVESAALQGVFGEGDYFDLNNIPLAAVERIEVVPEGSSAIYGSDAIAGVVNIILKKNFNGLEASAKYGFADGTDEWNTDIAWGKKWQRGSVFAVANFQTRSALTGFERSVTENATQLLGECNPGTVFSVNGQPLPGLGSATYAAVPDGFVGTPTIATFQSTAGTQSKCPVYRYNAEIPQTHRSGLLINGSFAIAPWVEAFTSISYSHIQQTIPYTPAGLYGVPSAGFSTYTVGASNPFNPFGETVGIAYLFTTQPNTAFISDTVFVQPVVGVRGGFLDDWRWDLSAYESLDDQYRVNARGGLNSAAIQAALDSSDPATALNPFTTGAPASQKILDTFFPDYAQTRTSGRTSVVAGSLHGSVLQLGSGPVQLAAGGEYDRDTLSADIINITPYYAPDTQSTYHRDRYAIFGEARIPLLANHAHPEAGETLVATVAGRFDHYGDFGNKATPQLGAEWRPSETLLFRDSFSRSFKAPSLFQLYSPQYVGAGSNVTDPLHGNQEEIVTVTTGGNPSLRPETGQSNSFGVVYSSKAVPNLQLSITHWNIHLDSAIQTLSPQIIVDNESQFPGDVTRAPTCTGGPPCPITAVNAVAANFGEINVTGFDYQLNYKYQSEFGVLTPSIAATETYRYRALLVPGSLPVDGVSKAQDDGDWAPRWKGTLALGWKLGPYGAGVTARYVGPYQDYDSTSRIGNFWLYDANIRYAVGQAFFSANTYLKGTYVELGGVNILDEKPQSSNFSFGLLGYDPAEADIRGRFLYARLGIKL